jgi:hypothetical protein
VKKLVKHNTHYTVQFKGFDTAHLNQHALDLHDHGHNFYKNRLGHLQTIANLEEIDKRIAKQHPELNFKLAKKYSGMVKLGDSIGRASDGTIPAHVVTGHKKAHSHPRKCFCGCR